MADDLVSTKAPPKAAKTLKGANHDSALSGKKRILTIHQTNDEGGELDVFLSINGYAYQIKRGEPVEVPEEVVEVLSNAKQELISFGPGGKLLTRVTPRYPFSVN